MHYMKNNLEPRAKIGDVVIYKVFGKIMQAEVKQAMFDCGCFAYNFDSEFFNDRHILKNLTTNVSYE